MFPFNVLLPSQLFFFFWWNLIYSKERHHHSNTAITSSGFLCMSGSVTVTTSFPVRLRNKGVPCVLMKNLMMSEWEEINYDCVKWKHWVTWGVHLWHTCADARWVCVCGGGHAVIRTRDAGATLTQKITCSLHFALTWPKADEAFVSVSEFGGFCHI